MLYISMHRAINSCRGMVWIGWWNVQINASIVNQRCRRCTFDSLRLASAYPGLCVLCGGQRHRCHASIPMNVFGNINTFMVQHHIFYADIPMDIFAMVNVTTMQCHSCHAGIPMNVFSDWNTLMVQRRIIFADIPMNTSTITNVTTTQRRRYYTIIPMDVFYNIHALMAQRRRCCAFDSPGLARNEPTLGKRSQGDSKT